jgi:DNA-binding SARP family transcriptional activator
MRFRVLGGLEVHDDGGHRVDLGGPKQRAVLASLLVALGRPVSVDQLQDQVWGDHPPANPETSLQAYVSNLRRALEPHRKPREPARVLVTQPAGYALLADRADVDLTAFEDLVAEAAAALAGDDAAAARAAAEQALARWGGPLLPELAGLPWVDATAAWLTGLRVQVLEIWFESGLRAGEHRSLVPEIERAVAEQPFQERLRALLALALYRSGRQRDALAALADARATLVDEVGVEPGPELRRLEADILAQAPSLDLRLPASPPRAAAPPAPAIAPAPSTAHDARPPGSTGQRFIGRRNELAALLDVAVRAAGGAGGPVVVSGEPGIGKTRLVEELVSRLPGTTVVAWGRCPESAAGAAYWPCIQIGRQLEGADAFPAELVTDLLPADDIQAPIDDPTADRLNLHVSVTKLLAAAGGPLVLVVDDLQWADAASLRLIEFVAGELRSTRVLLVATVRPVGPGAPPALIDCLGELARQPGALRIDLGGLSNDDVRSWLADRSAGTVDREVAEVVHDRTGGNPFFVSEVVELLTADGRPVDAEAVRHGSGVPAAVQDVVRRRVSRLSGETQQVLSAASVVGRTFDLDVLADVLSDDLGDLLDLLDPALAAGLLDELDLPGRLQFSHALVAETLEAEVTPGRRARLHAATARALGRLRAADLEGHLADMAHHAVEGAIAGTATEAYEWSVLAAQQDTSRRAHEEAAGHWARAVRALELARPSDTVARFEALREQGLAWLRVDSLEPGYAALLAAIDLAIAMGDQERVAQAAAAMNVDGLWMAGEVATAAVAAVDGLERALAAMSAEPSPERALVLGTLAEDGYWQLPPERVDEISAEAVEMARSLGDPVTLGRALHKRNLALWRAGSLAERAAAAEELTALADAHELPLSLEALAHFGQGGVEWERGNVPAAAAHAVRARALADRIGAPALITQLDYFLSTLAGFAGRLDEAVALGDRAYDLYRRTRRWAADALHAGIVLPARMEQGRIDLIVADKDLILDSPYRPWFQEGYAFALVQFGRLDEAAVVLDGQAPPLVDCWLYLGILGAATHVRVALGDTAGVSLLAGELERYPGRIAAAGTGAAFGDTDLALAAARHHLGDDEAALAHVERSVALLSAAGSASDLVRALLLRAELAPEGAPADVLRAAEITKRCDLTLLRARVEALL